MYSDSKSIIDKIINNISPTDFLEKSKGNSLLICPKCGSGTGPHKTGALKYYEDTKKVYCHKCGYKGDLIQVYQDKTGADFKGAVKALSASCGCDDTPAPVNQLKAPAEKCADYTRYYKAAQRNITHPDAVRYLESRGISTNTARKAGLGFDPKADPANAPGVMTGENKKHPVPRIIAPCTKSFYIARATNQDTSAVYRFINPSRKAGAGSSDLFNAAAITPGGICFVTEGLFDALSFLEFGYKAVALNGKGNGRKLIEYLHKRQPEGAAFIIVPDNDPEPENSADTSKRARELCSEIRRRGYGAIVYNVAGSHHDANDALTADRHIFETNAAEAIATLIDKAAAEDKCSAIPDSDHSAPDAHDDFEIFIEKCILGAYKGQKTGVDFFDRLTGGGITPQSLLIILGAPAAGKTTLCMQIAKETAAQGQPVIYFNLEMPKEQMFAKELSARLWRSGCDLPAKQILQGDLTAKEKDQLFRAASDRRNEMAGRLIYNPDGTGAKLDNIIGYLKRSGNTARENGQPAPAAIIDYLHLIRVNGSQYDAAAGIKIALDAFKGYAVEYNTFVLCIAAVNRESALNEDISMFSGRDTSGIEYDADYILTLSDMAKKKSKPAFSQQSEGRQMVVEMKKCRLYTSGRKEYVIFDAAHSLFTSDEKGGFPG